MPIKAENKNRYPPNWRDIRAAILERAGDCCEFQDRARTGVHERIRFAFGLHSSSALNPNDFDSARADLEGLQELAELHHGRMVALDEEFITAVIRPPVSVRKVRALATKRHSANTQEGIETSNAEKVQ